MTRYPNAIWAPWRYEGHRGGVSYYKGQCQPIGAVQHIMAGYITTALAWAKMGYQDASWGFSVSRNAEVFQHLDFEDGGFHAGISDAQGRTHPPTWELWRGLGININHYMLGIEYEGFPGEPFTPAQARAGRDLCKWIAAELGVPYDRAHFPPHADIDLINRVNDFNTPELREAHYAFMFEEDGMTPEETKRMVAEMVFGSQARYDELVALGVIPLEARVEALQRDGDTVARAAIAKHEDGHGMVNVPTFNSITITGVGLQVEEED